MSNRWHSKYHRHNHHTLSTANELDSSHDPIAAPDDPFLGSFVIQSSGYHPLSGNTQSLGLSSSGDINVGGSVSVGATPESNASTQYNITLGIGNSASGPYTLIAGSNNTIDGENSRALGSGNTASIDNATIIGSTNNNSGTNSSIVGNNNTITFTSTGGVVVGTFNEAISSSEVFIGGKYNTIEGGDYSSIVSGLSNTIGIGASSELGIVTSNYSIIAGGTANTILSSDFSTIIGGSANNIYNFSNSTVIGSDISADANNTTFVNNIKVVDGGVKIPTGAVNGYVFTTDANGNGTWQVASGGSISWPLTAEGNLDMAGYSITNVASASITFDDGSIISSDKISNWDTAYQNASAGGGGGSDVSGLSANWEGTYTTVQSNSGSWSGGGSVSLETRDTMYASPADWFVFDTLDNNDWGHQVTYLNDGTHNDLAASIVSNEPSTAQDFYARAQFSLPTQLGTEYDTSRAFVLRWWGTSLSAVSLSGISIWGRNSTDNDTLVYEFTGNTTPTVINDPEEFVIASSALDVSALYDSYSVEVLGSVYNAARFNIAGLYGRVV